MDLAELIVDVRARLGWPTEHKLQEAIAASGREWSEQDIAYARQRLEIRPLTQPEVAGYIAAYLPNDFTVSSNPIDGVFIGPSQIEVGGQERDSDGIICLATGQRFRFWLEEV